MEQDWEAWLATEDEITFETIEATEDFIRFKIEAEDEEYVLTRAAGGETSENEFWNLSVETGVESDLVDNVNSEYCMMSND